MIELFIYLFIMYYYTYSLTRNGLYFEPLTKDKSRGRILNKVINKVVIIKDFIIFEYS